MSQRLFCICWQISTHIAGHPRVDTDCVGHFVQQFWNHLCDNVQLLTVAVIGFLKHTLIATLLKLSATEHCATQCSSLQQYGDNTVISSRKISKYSWLICQPVSWLSHGEVPLVHVLFAGCSRLIHSLIELEVNHWDHCRKGARKYRNASHQWPDVE